MNTPNPLIPQGSLPPSRGNSSNVRIAVVAIVAIHAVFFGGLLMQGCKRDDYASNQKPPGSERSETNLIPAMDSNYYTNYAEMFPDPVDFPNEDPIVTDPPAGTNLPVASSTPPERVMPTIPSGQTIRTPSMPTTPERSPTTPQGEFREHTVARGENFSTIGRKYGVSASAIAKANPQIEPRKMRIGQVLSIPPASARPATATTASASADDGNTYVVKSGDNLTKIARQHKTTVAALKNANNLRTDRILAGQRLTVPVSTNSAN